MSDDGGGSGDSVRKLLGRLIKDADEYTVDMSIETYKAWSRCAGAVLEFWGIDADLRGLKDGPIDKRAAP